MNKVLYLIGGLTGVGGLGAGIAYLNINNNSKSEKDISAVKPSKQETSTKEAISSLLGKNQRTLLDNSNDTAGWAEGWKNFKNKYNVDNIAGKSWEFEGWQEAYSGNEATPAFKEKCKSNSLEEVENDKEDLYTEVKDFCTKSSG